MQRTTRAIVANAEWVHNTVFEPSSAILAWAVVLRAGGQQVPKKCFGWKDSV